MYRQDRFGMDNSVLQSFPFDRVEQQWVVDSTATAAGPVDTQAYQDGAVHVGPNFSAHATLTW
jgi:hypothetical protein